MTDYQWKVNKAATVASSYNKKKLYPEMLDCIRAASNSLGVPASEVAAECRRRYNLVVNRDKNAANNQRTR